MKMSWRDLFRRSRRRPMTCDEVGVWLQHYLDGELDSRQADRLEAHLEDCRRCGLEADTYRRIKQSLADGHTELPADSVARLREFGLSLLHGDGHAHR